MKKLISALVLLFSTGLYASPVLTHVPTTNVFAPLGFDSNDNAEVVVTGYLPNLCYKVPQHEVKVEGNQINIELKALHSAGAEYCLEMLVPFTEVVSIGVLDKGSYNVKVNAKEDENKTLVNKGVSTVLKIAESSSDAVDDFIYASVKNIGFENGDVILEGYNPSDCLALEEIAFIDNSLDAYSILPKMQKVSSFCPMKPTPFKYRAKLPDTLKANNILLHVRVMDGKSVNRVISKLQF